MQFTEKAQMLKNWLEEKNITDIDLIDISGIAADMDAFIIGTASNDRLARAAADFVEEKAEAAGFSLHSREGREAGKWILLDYVDVIIHIFQKEERELYNLEKLWADGRFIKSGKED